MAPRPAPINPYALANFVARKRLPWSTMVLGEQFKQILALLNLDDPEDLFPENPRASLLTAYCSLPRDVRFSSLDEAIAFLEGTARLRIPREVLDRVVPLLAPIERMIAGPGGRAPPLPALESRSLAPGSRAIGSRLSFLDPEQGLSNTCAAVATMIALAWVDPKGLTRRIRHGIDVNAERLRWAFLKTNGRPAREVTLTTRLFVDVDGDGGPVFCRSTEGRTECWPALLEKAIVSFIADPQPPDRAADEPQAQHYTRFNEGERWLMQGDQRELVQRVIDALTGCRSTDCIKSRPGELRGFIESRLDNEGRARCIMVAETEGKSSHWTRTYLERGLFPSHAYAVLGKPAGASYVLLRDPYAADAVKREELGSLGRWILDDPRLASMEHVLGVKAVPFDDLEEYFFAVYSAPLTLPPAP